MIFYLSKILITAVLVVLVTEVAKRSTLAGGILASIPLVSVLAFIWLYLETSDVRLVSRLSTSIFWLVIPSLLLFTLLPVLLKRDLGFFLSLALSVGAAAGGYACLILLLGKFGIRF